MIENIIGVIGLIVGVFLLGVQYGIESQIKKERYTMRVYNALERIKDR